MKRREDSIVNSIKTGGSIAIHIGTASLIRPIVKRHNQERNGLTKLCTIFSGTVLSCGISSMASKWFNGVVDKVADFIGYTKTPVKKEDSKNGK